MAEIPEDILQNPFGAQDQGTVDQEQADLFQQAADFTPQPEPEQAPQEQSFKRWDEIKDDPNYDKLEQKDKEQIFSNWKQYAIDNLSKVGALSTQEDAKKVDDFFNSVAEKENFPKVRTEAPSYVGQLIEQGQSGLNSLQSGVVGYGAAIGAADPAKAAEIIAANNLKTQSRYVSPEMREYGAKNQGFFEAAKDIVTNPIDIMLPMFAQSIGSNLPAMGASLVAGATAGAVAAPPTAGAGAPAVGIAVGLGTSAVLGGVTDTLVSFDQLVNEEVRKRGIDPLDPKAIQSVLEDSDFQKRAVAYASTRGAVITATELGALGLGSLIAGPAVKAAETGIREAVTAGKLAKEFAKQVPVQAAAEGVGEAAAQASAQVAVGEKVNVEAKQVAEEIFAGLPMSGLQGAGVAYKSLIENNSPVTADEDLRQKLVDYKAGEYAKILSQPATDENIEKFYNGLTIGEKAKILRVEGENAVLTGEQNLFNTLAPEEKTRATEAFKARQVELVNQQQQAKLDKAEIGAIPPVLEPPVLKAPAPVTEPPVLAPTPEALVPAVTPEAPATIASPTNPLPVTPAAKVVLAESAPATLQVVQQQEASAPAPTPVAETPVPVAEAPAPTSVQPTPQPLTKKFLEEEIKNISSLESMSEFYDTIIKNLGRRPTKKEDAALVAFIEGRIGVDGLPSSLISEEQALVSQPTDFSRLRQTVEKVTSAAPPSQVSPAKPFVPAKPVLTLQDRIDYYNQRLEDKTLLDKAVTVGEDLLVPTGGKRKIGLSSEYNSEREAKDVLSQIQGKPGFENAKIRESGLELGFDIIWGDQQTISDFEKMSEQQRKLSRVDKLKALPERWGFLGNALGYKQSEIDSFIQQGLPSGVTTGLAPAPTPAPVTPAPVAETVTTLVSKPAARKIPESILKIITGSNLTNEQKLNFKSLYNNKGQSSALGYLFKLQETKNTEIFNNTSNVHTAIRDLYQEAVNAKRLKEGKTPIDLTSWWGTNREYDKARVFEINHLFKFASLSDLPPDFENIELNKEVSRLILGKGEAKDVYTAGRDFYNTMAEYDKPRAEQLMRDLLKYGNPESTEEAKVFNRLDTEYDTLKLDKYVNALVQTPATKPTLAPKKLPPTKKQAQALAKLGYLPAGIEGLDRTQAKDILANQIEKQKAQGIETEAPATGQPGVAQAQPAVGESGQPVAPATTEPTTQIPVQERLDKAKTDLEEVVKRLGAELGELELDAESVSQYFGGTLSPQNELQLRALLNILNHALANAQQTLKVAEGRGRTDLKKTFTNLKNVKLRREGYGGGVYANPRDVFNLDTLYVDPDQLLRSFASKGVSDPASFFVKALSEEVLHANHGLAMYQAFLQTNPAAKTQEAFQTFYDAQNKEIENSLSIDQIKEIVGKYAQALGVTFEGKTKEQVIAEFNKNRPGRLAEEYLRGLIQQRLTGSITEDTLKAFTTRPILRSLGALRNYFAKLIGLGTKRESRKTYVDKYYDAIVNLLTNSSPSEIRAASQEAGSTIPGSQLASSIDPNAILQSQETSANKKALYDEVAKELGPKDPQTGEGGLWRRSVIGALKKSFRTTDPNEVESLVYASIPEAVETFNPDIGTKFSTYLFQIARQKILEEKEKVTARRSLEYSLQAPGFVNSSMENLQAEKEAEALQKAKEELTLDEAETKATPEAAPKNLEEEIKKIDEKIDKAIEKETAQETGTLPTNIADDEQEIEEVNLADGEQISSVDAEIANKRTARMEAELGEAGRLLAEAAKKLGLTKMEVDILQFTADPKSSPLTRAQLSDKYGLNNIDFDEIRDDVIRKMREQLVAGGVTKTADVLASSIDPNFTPKVENVQQLFNRGVLKIGKDKATLESEKLDRKIEAAAQDVGIYRMQAAKEVFVQGLKDKSVFVASIRGGMRVVNEMGVLEEGGIARDIAPQEATTTGEVSIGPKGKIYLKVMGINDPEKTEKLLLSGRVSPENFAKLGHFYPAEKVFLIKPSVQLASSIDPNFTQALNRALRTMPEDVAKALSERTYIPFTDEDVINKANKFVDENSPGGDVMHAKRILDGVQNMPFEERVGVLGVIGKRLRNALFAHVARMEANGTTPEGQALRQYLSNNLTEVLSRAQDLGTRAGQDLRSMRMLASMFLPYEVAKLYTGPISEQQKAALASKEEVTNLLAEIEKLKGTIAGLAIDDAVGKVLPELRTGGVFVAPPDTNFFKLLSAFGDLAPLENETFEAYLQRIGIPYDELMLALEDSRAAAVGPEGVAPVNFKKLSASEAIEKLLAKDKNLFSKLVSLRLKTNRGSETTAVQENFAKRKADAPALKQRNQALQLVFDFFNTTQSEKPSSQEAVETAKDNLPPLVRLAKYASDVITERVIRSLGVTKENMPKGSFEKLENQVRKMVNAQFKQELDPKKAATEDTRPAEQRLLDMVQRIKLAEQVFNEVQTNLQGQLNEDNRIIDAGAEGRLSPEQRKNLEELVAKKFDAGKVAGVDGLLKKMIDFKAEARKHMTQRGASLQSILTLIKEKLPELSEQQANDLAAQMTKRYEEIVKKDGQRQLENIVKRVGERASRDPKSTIQQLMELINLGAFDQEKFYNAIADRFNLPTWDPAVVDKIKGIADQMERMPEGSDQRATKGVELQAFIAEELYKQEKGWDAIGRKLDVAAAIWKAGVLSGPPTQLVNLGATHLNVLFELLTEARAYYKASKATGKKATFGEFFNDALNAYVQAVGKMGVEQASDAFATGLSRFRNETQSQLSPLEMIKFDQNKPWNYKNYLAAWKIVGRAMAAADTYNSVIASEAKTRMATRYALMKEGLNSEQATKKMDELFSANSPAMKAIEDQVNKEESAGQFGTLAGLKPNTMDYASQKRKIEAGRRRRYLQLREQYLADEGKIGNEGIAKIRNFTQKATFNNQPTGMIGYLGEAVIGQIAGKTKILTPFAAFPRTIANIINSSLDYTPYGWARANGFSVGNTVSSFIRNSTYAFEKPEKGSVEYHQLQAKAFFGSLITFSIIGMAMKDMDKDWDEAYFAVTGRGPTDANKREQLRQSGWTENTVKIGPLRFKHTDFPGLNLIFGSLALVSDQWRYGKLSEKDFGTVAATAALSVGNTIIDKNLLSGAKVLFDAVSEGGDPSDKAKRLLQSYTGGYLNPGMARWLTKTLNIGSDGKVKVVDFKELNSTTGGWLVGQTPLAVIFGKPMLNRLGEEIRDYPWTATSKRLGFLPEVKEHPVFTPLIRSGLFVPGVSINSKIKDFKGGKLEQRKMTREEYYDYSKYDGEYLKRVLTPVMAQSLANIAKTNQDAAQKRLEDLAQRARDYATSRIETQIRSAKK